MYFKRSSLPSDIHVVFLHPNDHPHVKKMFADGTATVVQPNHQTEILAKMIQHSPHETPGNHYNITATYTLQGPLVPLFAMTSALRSRYTAHTVTHLFNCHPLFRAVLGSKETEEGHSPYFAILPPINLQAPDIPEPPQGPQQHYTEATFPSMGFYESIDLRQGKLELKVASSHLLMDGGGASSLLMQFAAHRTLSMMSNAVQAFKVLLIVKALYAGKSPSVLVFVVPNLIQVGIVRLATWAKTDKSNTVEDLAELRAHQDKVKSDPRFRQGIHALMALIKPQTLNEQDFGMCPGTDIKLRGSFHSGIPAVYPLAQIRAWETLNAHRGVGFNAATLVQSSAQLALEILTGKTVATRVTRDPNHPKKPIAYNSNSLLTSATGNTLVDFHTNFGKVRLLQKEQKKAEYGSFETLPLEAYLDEISEYDPNFDAGGLMEFNPLDDRGNPMAPFIEFIAADTLSQTLNWLGFQNNWTQSRATFGNWYYQEPAKKEGDAPKIIYGPAISVSQIITPTQEFQIHVGTCKDRTEPWFATRLAVLTKAIADIWLENPEANPREILKDLITQLKTPPTESYA